MTALTTLHELGGVASLSGWIPKQSRQVSIALAGLSYSIRQCADIGS